MTDYTLDAEGGRYEIKGSSVEFTQALESWVAVRHHQTRIQQNLLGKPAHGEPYSGTFINTCYNLLLLYGFGVLEDALGDLADTGRFVKGKARSLGKVMAASKGHLGWRQFDLLDHGRERRNEIAHDRAIIPMEECLTYLDAIEDELVAWGVVPAQLVVEYRPDEKGNR
jgi:hypothetical protein